MLNPPYLASLAAFRNIPLAFARRKEKEREREREGEREGERFVQL